MQTTQMVTAKYTELYDISTDIGKNVHYKIHTPTGVSHMRKLAGLYKQFKEYKYLGASIAWVPITTLPKDLMGVGYEAGEGADPRDLINPILHKGYKGESLITDYLSERALWTENEDATDAMFQGDYMRPLDLDRSRRMTESGGVSKVGVDTGQNYEERIKDQLRAMYYTSLTDPEWGKAHPREGFYTELYPLVRTLASTQRIGPTGYPMGLPGEENEIQYKKTDRETESIHAAAGSLTNNQTISHTTNLPNTGATLTPEAHWENNEMFKNANQTDIFTHEFERLGWLETSGKGRQIGTIAYSQQLEHEWTIEGSTDLDLNRMPKVYMYLVQTPPAYKTKQYYRMSITHQFAFRKFRQVYGLDMPNVWSDIKAKIGQSKNNLERGWSTTIAGAKMYDASGTLHDEDFLIPEYEPALENTIEADGEANITKISDGVL